MSITIDLEPETEARLRERAERKGQDITFLAATELKRLVADDKDALLSADAALAALMNLSPEEKAAMHEDARRHIIPGRPLPPGKTLEDMVWGKWPGDETDEQINAALEELS